jgi:hypothetical protein
MEQKEFGSAWNQAGTWEEKHLKQNQVEDFFNNIIKRDNVKFGDYKVKDISNYSGDVIHIFKHTTRLTMFLLEDRKNSFTTVN